MLRKKGEKRDAFVKDRRREEKEHKNAKARGSAPTGRCMGGDDGEEEKPLPEWLQTVSVHPARTLVIIISRRSV